MIQSALRVSNPMSDNAPIGLVGKLLYALFNLAHFCRRFAAFLKLLSGVYSALFAPIGKAHRDL
jgi:hypothetical protein